MALRIRRDYFVGIEEIALILSSITWYMNLATEWVTLFEIMPGGI